MVLSFVRIRATNTPMHEFMICFFPVALGLCQKYATGDVVIYQYPYDITVLQTYKEPEPGL